MKNLQKLLFNAQRESVKNRLDVNISLALDDKVKQLYDQASVNAQRRLRNKKEGSASQQNTLLIEEFTVLLTQHCDKSDLLDPVKYEALESIGATLVSVGSREPNVRPTGSAIVDLDVAASA